MKNKSYKFKKKRVQNFESEENSLINKNEQKPIENNESDNLKVIKKDDRIKKVQQKQTLMTVTKKIIKSPVFKKGVTNPLIDEVIQISQQQEGPDNKISDDCCVVCTNRELMRLLRSQNFKQAQTLVKKAKSISTLK